MVSNIFEDDKLFERLNSNEGGIYKITTKKTGSFKRSRSRIKSLKINDEPKSNTKSN